MQLNIVFLWESSKYDVCYNCAKDSCMPFGVVTYGSIAWLNRVGETELYLKYEMWMQNIMIIT